MQRVDEKIVLKSMIRKVPKNDEIRQKVAGVKKARVGVESRGTGDWNAKKVRVGNKCLRDCIDD